MQYRRVAWVVHVGCSRKTVVVEACVEGFGVGVYFFGFLEAGFRVSGVGFGATQVKTQVWGGWFRKTLGSGKPCGLPAFT